MSTKFAARIKFVEQSIIVRSEVWIKVYSFVKETIKTECSKLSKAIS